MYHLQLLVFLCDNQFSPGVCRVRPSSQDIYQTKRQNDCRGYNMYYKQKHISAALESQLQMLGRSYQRRRGGCGVQKGCEVLVCVRVLVLVVVLMELKGKGWDTGLVLRSSTGRTRRSTRHRWATGRAAA